MLKRRNACVSDRKKVQVNQKVRFDTSSRLGGRIENDTKVILKTARY